jgi:hypothetical protein
MTSYRRIRFLAACGWLGCATPAITPLGCASTLESAIVQHGQANSGNRLPNITIERIQGCTVEFAPEFSWYKHAHVNANVEIDEDGLIQEVTTEGVPASSPDFGACARQVLREMAVPGALLQTLKAQLEAQKKTAGQPQAGGNLAGHPIVLVIAGVTLVFSDVVVQVAGITVLFTVTLELKDSVEALRRRRGKDPRDKCTDYYEECVASELFRRLGNHLGQSRCDLCRAWCRKNNGDWPSQVPHGDDYGTCAYKTN